MEIILTIIIILSYCDAKYFFGKKMGRNFGDSKKSSNFAVLFAKSEQKGCLAQLV